MGLDFTRGLPRFSALVGQAGIVPGSVDGVLDRIGALNVDFYEVEEKGLFVPLPLEEPEKSKDVSRIKTIRNRLANLGYLPGDSGRPYLDDEFRSAVRLFQIEADLDVDGWVGEQTWTALQELVSFEEPSNLLRWFDAGLPKAPLKRAMALRLFALGLTGKAPAGPPPDPSGGMNAFVRAWELLELGSVQPRSPLSLDWAARLFDQDGLARRLAHARIPSTDQELLEIHGFILNAAKVELWLAGYSVLPSGFDPATRPAGDETTGFDVWMISSTLTQYWRLKKNMRFYKALLKFWEDHEVDRNRIRVLTVDFMETFPEFFHRIAMEIQTDAVMSETEKAAMIQDFLRKYPEQIPTVWDHVRNLGNRIWDGIRRVWGWLKNLVQSAVKKVIIIGRNLSRLIYGYALGAYSVVANIFKSLAGMVAMITQPVMQGSDPRHAVMVHDRDFDYRGVIHGSADIQVVQAFCSGIRRQTRIFAFACRVLGLFMSILMTVVQSGLTGYTALIFSLVKIKAQLDRIAALAAEYRLIFGA